MVQYDSHPVAAATHQQVHVFSRAVFFIYLYFSISYLCCICSFFWEMNHDECTAGLLTVRGPSTATSKLIFVFKVKLFMSRCLQNSLIIQICSFLFRLNESCSLKSKHGPERELWSLGCLLFWVFCHLAVTLLPLTAT